jgi:PhnB protein
MDTPNFPADHQQVMPYLVIKGAADFIRFMQVVFAAQEKVRYLEGDLIAHAELMLGTSVLKIAEATAELQPSTCAGFIYVTNADAVYASALAAGAVPVKLVVDDPYGPSGGFMDPFGNTILPLRC